MNYYVKLGLASFFLSLVPAFAAAVIKDDEDSEPVVVVIK